MSMILTLTSRSSTLSIDFNPPIRLDSDSEYSLALLSFHSYNSIPNIEEGTKFYYHENGDRTKQKTIDIPAGSYEINDIKDLISKHIVPKTYKENPEEFFYLKPNNNTLKSEIFCLKHSIDFRPANSLARILGFSSKLLHPNLHYASDLPVDIIKVRTIHIDSNITFGAFYNDTPSHTIYEFAVGVDPGYAIDETPNHLIYLPISHTNEINTITLRVLDQHSQLVDFRNEEIIIRLELKRKYGANYL